MCAGSRRRPAVLAGIARHPRRWNQLTPCHSRVSACASVQAPARLTAGKLPDRLRSTLPTGRRRAHDELLLRPRALWHVCMRLLGANALLCSRYGIWPGKWRVSPQLRPRSDPSRTWWPEKRAGVRLVANAGSVQRRGLGHGLHPPQHLTRIHGSCIVVSAVHDSDAPRWMLAKAHQGCQHHRVFFVPRRQPLRLAPKSPTAHTHLACLLLFPEGR